MEDNLGILFITIAIIAFNAIGDAYKYKEVNTVIAYRKSLYSRKEALFTVGMVVAALVTGVLLFYKWNLPVTDKERWFMADIGYWILGGVLLRFGLFNFIFNMTAGLNSLYIGTTKRFDRLMRKIFYKNDKPANRTVPLVLLYAASIIGGMYIIQHMCN